MRPTTAAALLLSLPWPLLGPSTADAQRPPPPQARTVTVEATGSVDWEPDQAVVQVAVETFGETASEAAGENARITRAVIDALRDAGVADDRIRTLGYGLWPEYEVERRPQGADRRIVGYRATNTVEATIVELQRVGAVIDAAIEAGANRIAGLRFELSEPDEARREALRRAVSKARADASAIAEAADLQLGSVLRITTADAPVVRPVEFDAARVMEAAAPAAVPTPVEPGPIRTTADVTVVYLLEPR